MLIASISDLHGNLPDVIEGVDILTISGDISPADNTRDESAQLRYFYDVLAPAYSESAKEVVFVAGNHDLFLERIMERGNEKHFRDRLPRNVHYLRDSGIELNGLKFWGTPWTPTYFYWSFMASDDDAGVGKYYAKIPTGIDYLLSHGPASGHNDMITLQGRCPGQKLGSRSLLFHVKRANPSVLLAGHIHTGSHEYSNITSNDVNNPKNTLSINVSILDEQYRPHYMALYNTEE